MKTKSFLLALLFALTPAIWAQDKPAQTSSGPGSRNQMRAEHRQEMMEMHRQEMEAMGADIEKMKSSLAQMKANVLTIRDPNELSRWRNNVDMWETVVTHMDRMQKNMESMGPGMMRGHGKSRLRVVAMFRSSSPGTISRDSNSRRTRGPE